jgi:hypothetical protein
MAYDGSILRQSRQRQMRDPDELTHMRTGGRAKPQTEFPAPLIVRNEIGDCQQLVTGMKRDALAVRSLPNRGLTRERTPARAREAIQPGGRTGGGHTSHTLKFPGVCCVD